MNAAERDALHAFLRRVTQSRPKEKDPIANAIIQETLAQYPDALYQLVQQAMGSEMALAALRQRSAEQKTRAATEQPDSSKSLWSSGLLQTAGAVALGVTAGTLLADGIEDLFQDLSEGEGD